MLNAYLVDDEPLAVQRLARLLEATGRVRLAGSTTDPEAALAFLRSNAVDVIFLDIQMPGLSGFELLERLDRDVPVIFTTAFDQYALDAFNVMSIDYLLKPIEPDRLDRALDKLEHLAGQPHTDVRALARELAAQLVWDRSLVGDRSLNIARRPVPGSVPARVERIASRIGDRTTLVEVARVTHFFSKDKLTFAASQGRDHVVDHTLGELEALLDPRRFVRIHRATIVNVAFVQELDAWVDGGVLVRLKDEKKTELSVARDRVRDLKTRLGI